MQNISQVNRPFPGTLHGFNGFGSRVAGTLHGKARESSIEVCSAEIVRSLLIVKAAHGLIGSELRL